MGCVLLKPRLGYVLEPDCNNNTNILPELSRQFYGETYRDHFNNLFNSVGNWFKAMGEDPLNKQFGEDWARLTKDLLFVILPTLVDQLEVNNYVKFTPYDAITEDPRHHRIKLTALEQMKADMRDVAFYYHKKSGIPKLKDSGIADVLLGGEGLSVAHPASLFKVHDVHVKVNTLKFAIRDSNHDFLYETLRPLATSLIKKQIQRAIKDMLRTVLSISTASSSLFVII
ncbi:hypothetical protein BDZ97DRAFT_1914873 [Flammula alnicola]|nr:hypothetical protein BDZ97DRAFT_1914873 [Flammula alnicola]